MIDDKKINKPLVYVAIASTIITATWTAYRFFVLPQNQQQPTPAVVDEVFCTLDVKVCPNGATTVGRVPPDCEFEQCPATNSAEIQE